MNYTAEQRESMFCAIMQINGKPIYTEEMLDYLSDMGFFTAPASTKYHGAYVGGLFDHSKNVTAALVELTAEQSLKWQRPESPYYIGMFHDLCKCDQYMRNYHRETRDEVPYQYRDNMYLKGHGDKSVMLAATLTQLTYEEVLCIRYHMGAFVDKSEWNDYTRAIHKYPNVLWTHTADMIAAHVKEVV